LLAATLYQDHPDRNHNFGMSYQPREREIYTPYTNCFGMLLHVLINGIRVNQNCNKSNTTVPLVTQELLTLSDPRFNGFALFNL
jgi:hypothetical protein